MEKINFQLLYIKLLNFREIGYIIVTEITALGNTKDVYISIKTY